MYPGTKPVLTGVDYNPFFICGGIVHIGGSACVENSERDLLSLCHGVNLALQNFFHQCMCRSKYLRAL